MRFDLPPSLNLPFITTSLLPHTGLPGTRSVIRSRRSHASWTKICWSYCLAAHALKNHPADLCSSPRPIQTLAIDLLNRPADVQARTHKLKKVVPEPNSFFMDVKCPGCFAITTVFSHASTVVQCQGCATALCQPTGGKAKLTEGCSFRRKN
ncbi:40S ribosomal protein S27 [Kwoniella newhampshirensis]|uniref:40S ribosomal protein S27 n=1 Tax=Kwoniella newhampshirensis TaxID=1651941 RepID=A0AAW0YNK1_9TREE